MRYAFSGLGVTLETLTKNACVSTLLLKWYLIISQLQNMPWPRPDSLFRK